MQCDCIEGLKEKALEHDFNGRKAEDVEVFPMMLDLTFNSFTASTLEVKFPGRKRVEKMLVRHSFCPFCGKPTEPPVKAE